MRNFAPKFARRTRGLLNSRPNRDLEKEKSGKLHMEYAQQRGLSIM